jgi:hypothetical protein
MRRIFYPFVALILLTGCMRLAPTPSFPGLGVGFAIYTRPDPSLPPDYLAWTAEKMATRFPGAVPEAIWVVGEFHAGGTYLRFPCVSDDPHIQCSQADTDEAALSVFDQRGLRIWLEVQPGDADVEKIIPLVLDRYGYHPSVIGFGVDLTTWQAGSELFGGRITDDEAAHWVEMVRSYNPEYRLFLKHSLIAYMPPTARDDILFVNGSHDFQDLDDMLAEFSDWGQYFAPARVAFQYGHPDDQSWWDGQPDAPGTLGRTILEHVPNTDALFWLDSTIVHVYPPQL